VYDIQFKPTGSAAGTKFSVPAHLRL